MGHREYNDRHAPFHIILAVLAARLVYCIPVSLDQWRPGAARFPEARAVTRKRLSRAALLALWAVAAAFIMWGAPRVPFHPDESTYLYMSQDFDRLIFQGPASV